MSYQLPVISVVTPTFNRKDELVYLFDSIKKQTLDPKYFEMIISDDGSTDGTKEYVKSLKNQFKFNLSCVSQKNLGPGSARNNGVKNSKGELIVFIDSDCEADSNWLEIIYDAYKKNKFDAFGGPDEARGNFLPIQIAINFSMTSFLTTGGIRGHNKNMISKFFPRSHNMGVKKKLFEKIGGFGHLRHGQDIELSNRIINENAVVILLKNAVVYHRRRTTLLKFFRQVFNWGVARVNLGKIDSKMLQIVHFLPSIGFLISIISLICSFFFPFIFIPILVILLSSLLILCAFGGLKTKSIKVMFYLTLIIPCQVFGYGLGFFGLLLNVLSLAKTLLLGLKKIIIKLKNLLVITYYWPPSGGPGVQRVLKFCKYLSKYGWQPIILTVDSGDFPVIDNSLEKQLGDLKVYKSKSISFHKIFNIISKKKNTPTFQLSKSMDDSIFVKIARWVRLNFIIPDGRIGWYPAAVNDGINIIKKHNIVAIFSSAPPYTSHLIAKKLSKASRIPWAADFRDPWTDRFYNYENSRFFLTEKLDKILEKSVVESANKCITVSNAISNYFNQKFDVIHNGYDENDFLNLDFTKKNNHVIIRYLGTMTKSQNPKTFFKVVSNLNIVKNEFRIELIGNIHPDIKSYIYEKGFNNFITIRAYINHREAIQKMVDSDFLLLVIPDTEKNQGIVTGKLFEYIRSMTRVLAIGPVDCDASKIIFETNSGAFFDYDDSANMEKFLLNKNYDNSRNYEKYSRENSTMMLADILNDMIENHNLNKDL